MDFVILKVGMQTNINLVFCGACACLMRDREREREQEREVTLIPRQPYIRVERLTTTKKPIKNS